MLIFLLCLAASAVLAFEVPCTEKLLGGICTGDGDCYGAAMMCANGYCACVEGFEGVFADGTNTSKLCRPAPDRVNEACLDTCKAPLLCERQTDSAMGRCQCVDGRVVNGRCVVDCPPGKTLHGVSCRERVSHVNDVCEEEEDCIDAFTTCTAQRGGVKSCRCIKGTSFNSQLRRCLGRCADGSTARRVCSRLYTNDIDMVEHKADGDTCSHNQYCATYGSPSVGHCCPIFCPMGEADSTQSCDAGAINGCRPMTHYCHSIQSPGYSKSVCCPRPCRDPRPVLINGTCHTEAHLGDPCVGDSQCEGGKTMLCRTGICRCRPLFSPVKDGSTAFPTCHNVCRGRKLSAVGAQCVDVGDIGVGDKCVVDGQCPNKATCTMGVCSCDCGLQLLNEQCVDPDDRFGLGSGGTQFISTIQNLLGGGKSG